MIEIIDIKSGRRVVTLIEILSPSDLLNRDQIPERKLA